MHAASLSPEAFIAAARSLIGVPYRAAGACESGANCLGLWAVVSRRVGLDDLACDVERHSGFARPPDRAALLRGLLAAPQLIRVKPRDARPGDLLLFKVARAPQHLALVTEPDMILHADAGAGRVVEHARPPAWRAVAAFRLAALTDTGDECAAAAPERA